MWQINSFGQPNMNDQSGFFSSQNPQVVGQYGAFQTPHVGSNWRDGWAAQNQQRGLMGVQPGRGNPSTYIPGMQEIGTAMTGGPTLRAIPGYTPPQAPMQQQPAAGAPMQPASDPGGNLFDNLFGGGITGGPIHGPQISPYEPLGALTAPPPNWAGLDNLGAGTDGARTNFADINQSNFYPAAFNAYQQGRELDSALGFDRDLARAQTSNRYGSLSVQQMANQLLRSQPGLDFLGRQISIPLQVAGQALF